jgi:hypothetical protein
LSLEGFDMNCQERMRSASRLRDDELGAELCRLARAERGTTASLIAHLAEFDARRLHLAAGYPSLFRYCTESLRLSEHEAYNRVEAAQLARRFPVVIDMIEGGALNLTTARLLAPHLTDDNHMSLLTEASYKTKGDVEQLLVCHFPRPLVSPSIRKVPGSGATACLPSAAAGCSPARGTALALEAEAAATKPHAAAEGGTVPSALRPRPGIVRPLAPDRYEIRFTATGETCEKLRTAKDLLHHAVPNGDIATIVDRALTLLLEDLARKKFAATRGPTPRPRSEPASTNHEHQITNHEHPVTSHEHQTTSHEHQAAAPLEPGSVAQLDAQHGTSRALAARAGRTSAPTGAKRNRRIPADVRRAVWLRDAGRCAFMGTRARRCNASGLLEFHHVQPFSAGGDATIDNIQLRCRAHNGYEADLFYGRPGPEQALHDREANPFRNESGPAHRSGPTAGGLPHE